MKQIYIVLTISFFFTAVSSNNSLAQKFKSTSSSVHFFSDAPVEDIEATNLASQSAMDLSSGDIVFSIPIKSFTFEKSLMQEHFNENYLESDKYPAATFIGKISGYDVHVNDAQEATANGKIKIHGVEQEITVNGKFTLTAESLEINAKFPIKLEDFNIKIPKVVFYNIAEIIEVSILFSYEKID